MDKLESFITGKKGSKKVLKEEKANQEKGVERRLIMILLPSSLQLKSQWHWGKYQQSLLV